MKKQISSIVINVLISGVLSLAAVKAFPDLVHYLILACLIYILLQEMDTKL